MGDFAMLSWLAIGVAVGVVSKLLYPGRADGDWLKTIVVGVTGALLDGWGSAHLLGQSQTDSVTGCVAALVGAVITVVVYRFVLRRNLML